MIDVVWILDRAAWAGTERHVRSLLEAVDETADARFHLVTSERGPLTEEAARLGHATHVIDRFPGGGYVLRIQNLLGRIRPALVHAHAGRAACLGARLAGVPVILETRHGLPEKHALDRSPALRRRIEGWKLLLPDRTIAVCESDRNWLVVRAGVDPSRVTVIPNGIPLRPAAPPRAHREGGPRLGFVGRLIEQKNPLVLAPLLARVALAVPSVRLELYGDGPLRAPLEQALRTHGVWERARLHGEVPDIDQRLAELDLLLLPSIWEGTPYVVLEALRAEVPILAAPVDGVPELLDGPALGRSLVPWDLQSWAREATEILSGRRDLTAWKLEARVRVGDRSEEQMLELLFDLYAAELARRRIAPSPLWAARRTLVRSPDA